MFLGKLVFVLEELVMLLMVSTTALAREVMLIPVRLILGKSVNGGAAVAATGGGVVELKA